MKAHEWIDRLKVEKALQSDYAAAKMLGLTTAAVSKIRTSDSTLGEDTAVRLAENLGIEPAFVLADQAMERAKNGAARRAWEAVAEFIALKEKTPELVEAGGFELWRKRRDSNPR